MTAKPKPLTYFETHAGRGFYDLASDEARKTGEAAQGIARAEGWFAADHPYLRALRKVRARHGATTYPGSPGLAAAILRPGDRMILAELHPQENAGLQAAMAGTGATIRPEDGFALALSATPPEPRRGLMLVDPSYEVKADYARIPTLVAKVHRRWNVGVILVWYPILTDGRHAPMLGALESLDLPKALRSEVCFPPARTGHGMVGSGIFAVNAPWGMENEARRVESEFRRNLPGGT
jgi:23S rRNA (adenine2030-N6)-methyltransferase